MQAEPLSRCARSCIIRAKGVTHMPPEIAPATIAVLRFIANSPGQRATVAALESKFGSESACYRIQVLRDSGYITASDYVSDPPGPVMRICHPSEYCLTPMGADILTKQQRDADGERQQRAEKDAEEHRKRLQEDVNRKKQFRHDWRVAIVSSILAFISGLVVAHFVDIAGYCAALLSAWFQG